MTKRVVVMSGISGSGKSTYIKNNFPDASVVSADMFFEDKDGNYNFDPSKLSEAHAYCFRNFVELMIGAKEAKFIVIDNTNATAIEIAPYMLGAQAYGYDPEIITIVCKEWSDSDFALARNVHDVPSGVITKQFINIRDRKLPPWWKNTNVQMSK